MHEELPIIEWVRENGVVLAVLVAALFVMTTAAILSTRRADAVLSGTAVQRQPAGLGWAVGLLLGLIAGYFAGREHLKYEIRQAALGTVDLMKEELTSMFTGNRDIAYPSKAASIEDRNERIRYINDHLELSEVRAHRHYLPGGPRAWTSAHLRNKGGRALKRIEITGYLLGASGERIFKFTSDAMFSGKQGPARFAIAPYASGIIVVSSGVIPETWADGRLQLGITEIEWAED